MFQRSQFRKWASMFAVLSVAGLVTGPLSVRSQTSPNASFPPDTPASEQQNVRRPSGPGTGGGADTGNGRGAGSQRRQLDVDSHADPFQLTQKPSKIEPPHPLAAAYPNHNVIVCVAGCWPTANPSIVYIAARTSTSIGQTATGPGQIQLVADAIAAPSSATVECLAGCVGPRPAILRSSARHRQASAPVTLARVPQAKLAKVAKPNRQAKAARPAKTMKLAKLARPVNRTIVR